MEQYRGYEAVLRVWSGIEGMERYEGYGAVWRGM